ncbi:MAG: ABC transporter ATP-binding protein [Actinobacteria bacterium]|jgi:ABC-2 type transport system ATP-binding protein|nr:MAG: ABC transporter ATP-binding protein [Actinomycetota bacterium]
METVLSIEDLHKEYSGGWRKPPRTALAGLNLVVPRGKTIGLLGPNGAGKTTTLKCIMGLIRPQAGKIDLFGGEVTGAGVRKSIGFLPEQPYFDLYLTPRKLLAYYGRLSGMHEADIAARTAFLLNLVGMGEEADLSMDKYSKGMLQRIGLAQALISQPEFLVLDEPSSGLDPLGKLQVRDLLLGLKGGGTTILLSSHQLSEIEEICDGVAIIHKGANIASGGLDELLRPREEYEISLEKSPPPAAVELPASASWADPAQTRLLVNKGELNEALRSLLERGALVAEVRQRRMTLEEYFVEQVGSEGWEVGE